MFFVIALNIAIIINVILPSPLSYKGKTVAEWTADLNDNDQKKRDAAELAFKELGTRAVPDLIATLRGKDSWFQKKVFAISPKLPSFARRLLARAVRPVDWQLQHMLAARALGMIGPRANQAVPALDEALQGTELPVRSDAASALGKIGKDSVPFLIHDLHHERPSVRQNAAYALGVIGTNAAAAIPLLIEKFADTNDYVQLSAANALGNIGEAAAPAIIQAIQERKGIARRNALRATVSIYPNQQFVQPILGMLKDTDAANRREAIRSLSAIKPSGKEIVAVAPELLKDTDSSVRLEVIKALAKTPTRARAVIPNLTDLLQDSDPAVQQAVRETLDKINSSPLPQLPSK